MAHASQTPSRVAVSTLVGGLFLTACSESESSSPEDAVVLTAVEQSLEEAREQGSESQIALLADGDATAADYRAAYDDYLACVGDLGYTTPEPMLNPIDNQRLIADPAPDGIVVSDEGRAATGCRDDNMSIVEMAYLATSTALMDAPIMSAAQACLSERGQSFDAAASNVEELTAGGPEEERFSLVAECVTEAAAELRPDLPYIGVAY